jgi:glutathione S-transferase
LEISESIAIAQYFDRAFDGPALVPSDAKAAAKVDQWVARITTSLDQLLMRRYVVPYAFHRDDDGNVIRTEIDKAVKRFPKVFPMLDAAVADGFIAGADFSLADCFLAPMLAAVSNFPEGKEAIEANPNLKAYFERMSARESFQNTAG